MKKLAQNGNSRKKMNSLKYNTHTVMELTITSTGIEISEEITHGVLPGTTSLVCHHTTVS